MRNGHVATLISLIGFAWLGLAIPAQALRVSPGSFSAQGIPVGIEKDMQLPFIISHTGNDTIKVTIECILTSAIRKEPVPGFIDLPNAHWLRVDAPDTVLIPPMGEVKYRITWLCPADPRIYNQHYAASVIVKTIGGMYQTAVVPVFLLETEVNDSIMVPSERDWSVAPSRLHFITGTPEAQKLGLQLFNQTAEAITCTLSFGLPDTIGRSVHIASTPGYHWILPDKGINFPPVVTIPAHGRISATVGFTPENAGIAAASEALLKLSYGGIFRFVRLRFSAAKIADR